MTTVPTGASGWIFAASGRPAGAGRSFGSRRTEVSLSAPVDRYAGSSEGVIAAVPSIDAGVHCLKQRRIDRCSGLGRWDPTDPGTAAAAARMAMSASPATTLGRRTSTRRYQSNPGPAIAAGYRSLAGARQVPLPRDRILGTGPGSRTNVASAHVVAVRETRDRSGRSADRREHGRRRADAAKISRCPPASWSSTVLSICAGPCRSTSAAAATPRCGPCRVGGRGRPARPTARPRSS